MNTTELTVTQLAKVHGGSNRSSKIKEYGYKGYKVIVYGILIYAGLMIIGILGTNSL
jgi:hypothetical protein